MFVLSTMPNLRQVPRGGSQRFLTLCGVCNQKLDQREVDFNYTTTCVVCSEKCWVHPKCAKKLLRTRVQSHVLGTNNKINSQIFRQTSVDLFCALCEDSCYICNVRHTSKCLISINFISIDIILSNNINSRHNS